MTRAFTIFSILRCCDAVLVVIEQKQISRYRSGGSGNLFQFALANQSCGVRLVAMLQELAGNLCTRAGCKRAQFIQRLFRAEFGNRRGFRGSGHTTGAVARCLCARGQRTLGGVGSLRRTRTQAVVDSYQESALRRTAIQSGRNRRTSPPPFFAGDC